VESKQQWEEVKINFFLLFLTSWLTWHWTLVLCLNNSKRLGDTLILWAVSMLWKKQMELVSTRRRWAFKYNTNIVKLNLSAKICVKTSKGWKTRKSSYVIFFLFLLLIIGSQLVRHTQTESNSSIFQFQMILYQKVDKNLFEVNPQSKACQNSSLLHIFIIVS